ncbi:MAG: Efflux transport system, outer membrane factor (OMF) lipoprotein [uncultured Segetibacter sp.]|uniref:Efflux transport system, outer membrane factor (OMF) lipoprotein n=1 Tax=uncultured Segetibacter sp. TaxID=481133 RepID=A0A6J4TL32_9BACT|nr:MAG: Efflux transport system, outer membrane factor (OMF) lipoprotein [uncultured Segetibacter sp.]
MKKMYKQLYILLFLVLIISCRVGRNYQRPALELPTQFANTTTSDTSSIAAMEWKRFFTDTTLQRLIQNALVGNFDLQLATKRIAEAEAYVKQARMNYVPTVQAQVSATTTLPSKNSLNGISLKSFLGTNHVEDYSLAVGVSWEADVWGKMRRQKEAAFANYLQTYEGTRAVQTALVADIANSYFNLLMLDAQMAVTRKNLALSDTIVLMMRLQKNAGQVTELAVQQAEVQQQTAALIVPQLEQQITIEENTLRILTGELPAPVNRYVQLQALSVWDELPTGLPAAMVSRRPDVRATEMALVAANANVGIAQAYMYPSLNITATGGLNAFKASKWFVIPTSLFGTAAGAVIQPILQRRQLKTQLEVAQIQRDEAVISFRKSALTAIGEVVNAMVSLDKLKTQKQIAAAQVDTLQKAIHNAEMLFKSGLADYLEVITAQSNSLQAELALADIQRQRLSAMVELYRSLGGGVK